MSPSLSTEDLLRLTVSALMSRTGERQGDLAVGIGQAQAQVSRKQTGRQHWTLDDVDRIAGHYGVRVLDLLAGPTHAVTALPAGRAAADQTLIPLTAAADVPATFTAAPPPLPAPRVQGEAAVPARGGRQGGPCVLCGAPAEDEVEGIPQHLTREECAAATDAAAQHGAEGAVEAEAAPVDPTPDPTPEPEPEPTAAPAPAEPAAAAAPPRRAPGYASSSLVDQINARVRDVLTEHQGDYEEAQAALIKSAIPDVMALFKASRVGGRYEHSEFPPTHEILNKRSQKGADEIWEGRPKWRNREVVAAAKNGEEFEVTALDMNAAYLSALKCWLPIGRLQEDTSGTHNPKKAGVHLITPAEWDHPDLPNPLGNRMEPGELWVTESTLRLLLDVARPVVGKGGDVVRPALAEAPVIHRSLVSGATEALLEKLRRALAEVRKNAIAEGDGITLEYVKSMYSKFVSTIGESSSNRELRRPDMMHIIRSKAFANLWMKAEKARAHGLTVVEISGTDELHVVGDWRKVFPEGRDLNQVKEKRVYMLGGKR
ncbi:acyltransferase (plasmid) [Streptomyces sp. BB1-1-1]|uniref:acyltransferase n=1 Tax=Streptomyces sp. BB1-1-1 TaxID=3074430 RepID=UPI0028772CBD|nr:acyltransferase [Streptomyces sp. BB1-1-1]WND40577.1 acyltransferase [Streptomyces sp. BB1-1-1]